MSSFNAGKLSVEFAYGTTASEPVISRRYTLTHSDTTGELFLTVGKNFAYNKLSVKRDEVLGEWVKKGENYFFLVNLHLDGHLGKRATVMRNRMFMRELPLALRAIRYGDREFFRIHPDLDYSQIVVYFKSSYPQYNRAENWGTFSGYIPNNSNRSYDSVPLRDNRYLLDSKTGDVTGDGIPDKVSLYGNKSGGPEEIFSDNITIVIEDGHTKEEKTITPQFNAGYNARLFLGDFTRDGVEDIKLGIDSGGSGGYGFFYIYSYKNNDLQEIFNFDKYNVQYKYKVDYADNYRVNVGNLVMDKLFVIDISHKGYEYLSQYYNDNGKLKHPVQGEVLALGNLVPAADDEKNNYYDLLALQRIIGTTNSDTLGFVENVLTWDGVKFRSSMMLTGIMGSNMIVPYQL